MYTNKRLALSIFWIIAGVALMVLSIAEVLDGIHHGTVFPSLHKTLIPNKGNNGQ